jgi:hypothetical protein
MSKTKFITSLLLAMTVLFAQVGIVAAAPRTQETTPPAITGITTETDENGVTTVLVTLQAEGETPQTVRISVDYAIELGLIDPVTREPVLLENVPPDTTIDPDQVIEVVPSEEPAEDVHPIAAILANFFDEDPGVVNEYHLDGYGFGVIAQAMWISRNLTGTEDEVGDASLAGEILEAKRDKNYEAFFLEHQDEFGDVLGDEMPTNWGQFKKVLKEKRNNLGTIVSGQANESTEDPTLQQNPGQQHQNQGNGQDKDKGKNKNKNKKKP